MQEKPSVTTESMHVYREGPGGLKSSGDRTADEDDPAHAVDAARLERRVIRMRVPVVILAMTARDELDWSGERTHNDTRWLRSANSSTQSVVPRW